MEGRAQRWVEHGAATAARIDGSMGGWWMMAHNPWGMGEGRKGWGKIRAQEKSTKCNTHKKKG